MADLDDRYVAKAKKLVFEKFPEMNGIRPSVSVKKSQGKELPARQFGANPPPSPAYGDLATGSRRNAGDRARYVLMFEREVSLPGGGKMKRLVRLTMDEDGEVLRLSSSK